MVALYGLTIEEMHGTYRLAPYDTHTALRLILIARKGASAS